MHIHPSTEQAVSKENSSTSDPDSKGANNSPREEVIVNLFI